MKTLVERLKKLFCFHDGKCVTCKTCYKKKCVDCKNIEKTLLKTQEAIIKEIDNLFSDSYKVGDDRGGILLDFAHRQIKAIIKKHISGQEVKE